MSPPNRRKTILRPLFCFMLPLVACLILGTAWHEIMGHGLAALLLGGRIERVEVLGFQGYPALKPVGWKGYYGFCETAGLDQPWKRNLMGLAGSLSTWMVSLVSIAWLGLFHLSPRWRAALFWTSLWWIDIFTYTLPTWGLRRSILWGGRVAEPYDAAVALGVPGLLFQLFVVSYPIFALLVAIRALRRHRRDDRRTSPGRPQSEGAPASP